jgi:hypothetical protein
MLKNAKKQIIPAMTRSGIVKLSGRGMLVVSVARQLGLGNSFARLLCCPAQAERGGKRRLGSAKLTMPSEKPKEGSPTRSGWVTISV